jgi:L-lactate utilization protein LutC
MPTSRDAFLQRVRQALSTGNRPGTGDALPARGSIGYQGAGPEPVERFRTELTVSGGQPHIVGDIEAGVVKVCEIVRGSKGQRVLLGEGPFLDKLDLSRRLHAIGVQVNVVKEEATRDVLFAADISITGVDYLIAETGSLVVSAQPNEPRSLSLLPPVHIAVADRSQLLGDCFDLFQLDRLKRGTNLPSNVTLITGPSKTGDIELRLVTGVHGPGELHVVLVTE